MNDDETSTAERWARLRFAIIGPLLTAPPAPGELRAALAQLAAKSYRHPITGEPVQFAFSTPERRLYTARSADRDPVGALRARRRTDAGRSRRLTEALRQTVHETTLPYSAYQNAKQEVFWAQVEGRLLPMLEHLEPLTLDILNDATLPWVEMEYNRSKHRELGCTPTASSVPQHKSGNAGAIAPLLRHLIAEYAATGLPPAYLPFNPEEPKP